MQENHFSRQVAWTSEFAIMMLFSNSVLRQQPVHATERTVVGKWTLCTTRYINYRKGLFHQRRDTSMVMGNVCTHVVFHPDGTGYSGLGTANSVDKHAFTWKQQATALTIEYEGEDTRLQRGVYQVKFTIVPARQGISSHNQLELSRTPNSTHFLTESSF